MTLTSAQANVAVRILRVHLGKNNFRIFERHRAENIWFYCRSEWAACREVPGSAELSKPSVQCGSLVGGA